jgi:transcriptional regulator of acetoin/glycerol metabolism
MDPLLIQALAAAMLATLIEQQHAYRRVANVRKLKTAVDMANGNKKMAGVSRSTLYRRLRGA